MKIVFFHMNQLGDLLFSLPVISAARAQNTENRIYCVARPHLLPLIDATGLADVLIAKDFGFCLCGKWPLLSELRKEKLEKGVFFSESPETMFFGFAGGIKERIGFSTASLSFLLNKRVGRSGVPSLENNRKLALASGFDKIPVDYCGLIKIPAEKTEQAELWLKDNGIDVGKLVVISPGASKRRGNKSWPVEGWKKLLKIISDNGYSPVITGAPGEKASLENIVMGLEFGVKVFASESGIMSLAALIKKAKLFIGIDSGAMHLSASLGTKVVALFGPTDPSQIGPMPLDNNIVIKKNNMAEISAEEVWEKASKYLPR